jgi:hypothetical protein
LNIGVELSVGASGGSTGSVTIENGATVSNSNGYVASGGGSTGSVIVRGAGSVWTKQRRAERRTSWYW